MTQPETRTVSGVEVATIPATDYADPLDCRRQLTELKAVRSAFEAPPRSRIGRDLEVAAFVAERLGKATVPEIERKCLVQFGKRRTPNRKAIHRYWNHVRRLAAWSEHFPAGPPMVPSSRAVPANSG